MFPSLQNKIKKDIKNMADSGRLYTTHDIFLILEKYLSKESIIRELGITEGKYDLYKRYKELKSVDKAIFEYFKWRLHYGN